MKKKNQMKNLREVSFDNGNVVIKQITFNPTNEQKAIKRMIIENFMLWYTGELTELMQDFINEYVEDDHVNELTK
jgi:hypothetical protein